MVLEMGPFLASYALRRDGNHPQLVNHVVPQPLLTCWERSLALEELMGNPGISCLVSNRRLHLGSESPENKDVVFF